MKITLTAEVDGNHLSVIAYPQDGKEAREEVMDFALAVTRLTRNGDQNGCKRPDTNQQAVNRGSIQD